MPKVVDVWGLALLEWWAGMHGESLTVYSSVAEIEEIPVDYLFRSWNEMPPIEQQALELCGSSVLDAGAGAGSHALLLQERGHAVNALDVSEGAIEVMRARGVDKCSLGSVFEVKNQRFDTILLLMNGIGMVETLVGLERFLQHAQTLLHPGGQLLLESTDISYIFEQSDGSILFDLAAEYYGVVDYQLIYKQAKGTPFQWLFIDFELLAEYAQKNGFSCKRIVQGEANNYLAALTLLKT